MGPQSEQFFNEVIINNVYSERVPSFPYMLYSSRNTSISFLTDLFLGFTVAYKLRVLPELNSVCTFVWVNLKTPETLK